MKAPLTPAGWKVAFAFAIAGLDRDEQRRFVRETVQELDRLALVLGEGASEPGDVYVVRVTRGRPPFSGNTRRTQVLAVLGQVGKSIPEIVRGIGLEDTEPNRQVVRQALAALKRAGRAENIERGLWKAMEATMPP